MNENNINIFKPKILKNNSNIKIDPITTEIIRSSLNSAAEQMKKNTCSFSILSYNL